MNQNPRPELIEAITSFLRQANQLEVVVMVLAMSLDTDEMPVTASNSSDGESIEARARFLREWADFLESKDAQGRINRIDAPAVQ